MNRAGMLLVAALGLPLIGCDRAWRTYEAIELGRPLPPVGKLPEAARLDHLGLTCGEMAFSTLPWGLNYGAARAAVGPDGTVKVKTYAKLNQTHWLLFISTEYQLVMELEVPPEAFRDSPERSGKLLDTAVRTMVATIEAMSLPVESAVAGSGPAPASAEGVRAARTRHLRTILSRAERFRNLGWAISAGGKIAPASRPAAPIRPKERADVASYA